MKVRCGLLTAQQAAEYFEVSRKTYDKWEERGLSALLSSLADQASGRPFQPVDLEKQALERQLEQADRECAILQHKMALMDVLSELKLTLGMSRAEKNERIGRVLAMITEAKPRYGLPIRILTAEMGLCPATLRRWRWRISRGEAPVGRRGPRKVKPLNLSESKERIEGLGHGRKRSRGSGSLHRTYANGISRRDLDAMVRTVRQETSRSRVANTYHVSWLRPNLA